MRGVAASLLLLFACAGPGPVVEHHTHEIVSGALGRVAVVPFHAAPDLLDDADVVSRIVAETFAEAGFEVVPPSDLAKGFEARGASLPRRDVGANAELAAREFGATTLVLGQLHRYREREGGAAGALRPASAYFELAIHTAPEGELLYTARFDQTQRALSADPLMARRYPGHGTRWLSVAELLRWGVEELIATLPEALR